MTTTTRQTSPAVLECLNKLFLSEMAGVIRYLHYSFMILGHNRIPIQKWFRDHADECKTHAIAVGEQITSFGGHPPVLTHEVEESNVHTINQMLQESLAFEQEGLEAYGQLARMAAEAGDIALEEFARAQFRDEQEHIDEVRKMLRTPQN